MWNPLLETMDRSELERLQVAKIRRQVAWAIDQVPFYTEKFEGIDPATITSLADVRTLPTTTKAELGRAQTDGESLYGELQATDADSVAYHQTSGTSGEPIKQADSRRDWEWWATNWATVLWAAGIRPDDRVFIPFSYNVFIAFWAGHYACERIGAEVVPGGSCSSVERVSIVEDLSPSAMMTTPTYALRLAEVAEQEGIPPADTTIERIVCAGEIGASVPATRDRIADRWGAAVYDHAGATETGAWGYDCGEGDAGIHFNEAMFLVELLDREGEPVEPGETGRLVVTPLDRRSQPVIRFEQGDLVTKGPAAACPCGRSYRYAPGGVLGRADDFKLINGVLLSPRAVEDVIRGIDGLSDEYRVVLGAHEEKAIDVATVIVEVNDRASDRRDEVTRKLESAVRRAIGLTVRIEMRDQGSLERSTPKAERIIDTR